MNNIKITYQGRPCLVGGTDQMRGIFYGFSVYGTAMVELEDGSLAQWDTEEILLLDSLSEFKQYPWEGLIGNAKRMKQ